MKRREVMVGITALLVSPRHSRAQGKPRRIGFLGAFADEPGRDTVHAAWLSGLRETVGSRARTCSSNIVMPRIACQLWPPS